MRRSMVVIVALAFALFGCGGDDVSGDGDAWKLHEGDDERDDAGVEDAMSDAATGDARDVGDDDTGDVDLPPDMDRPGTVTFRLQNESSLGVFAGLGVGADGLCGHMPWLEVFQDGQSRRLYRDCSTCECGESSCGVCDVACVTADEHTMRLEAKPPSYSTDDNESRRERTYTWDGTFWEWSEAGCQREVAPAERRLTARFCWGTGIEFGVRQAVPANVECAEVEFDRLTADVVTHVIEDDDVMPPATHFELKNGTNDVLYARPGNPIQEHCLPSFMQVNSTLKGQLTLYPRCGNCYCSEVDDRECPQPCAAGACAPSDERMYRLAPGDSRTFDWGGVAHHATRVQGEPCMQPFVPSADPLHVEFCWSDELATTDPVSISEETCVIRPFQIGDDVVHEIAP